MLKEKINNFLSMASHILASILSYLIPKKKNYWVFISFQYYGKYSGNNKALFEYIHKHRNRLKINSDIIYITNNRKTEEHIRNLKLPVIYNRFFWLYPLLRAEYIFTDGTRSFMGFGLFKFIQIWHGTGYKNIGLSYKGKKYSGIRHYFLQQFFKKMILVCATSEEDKLRKEIAFQNSNVRITGSPRNDIFFEGIQNNNDLKKRILYAPTFRDTGGKFSAMRLDDWESLDALMKEKDAIFFVKKHPSDYKLQVPTSFERIIDITQQTEDIQTLLASVDVLITDYSGIASDFVITGKPIIFYTYDFEQYIQTNRSFYYDIEKVLPGPFVKKSTDLMNYLNDFSWFENEDYQAKYDKFRNTFHTYLDGNSSKRFLDEVIKIIVN
ncbi:CDP-glycerol glycerophosphotransferase family protein [Leadbetterella sp. DM7]|uniref:CDP-glycerol glycerophosphotransferase family protein n=1 Tax=Leadbetterella sp. DM7 TaxID=3235085 RepID=UPI00349EB454